MPTQDQINAEQQLLHQHRRTLTHLRHQQARYGVTATPSSVLNDIEDARADLAKHKATLRGWGVEVDDLPGDLADDDRPPTTDDRRPPTCPRPSANIVGRDAFITDIVARLSGGAALVAVCAVRGLPGVGKTDLLRAVGNDPRTLAAFTGGVLYAELGPNADVSVTLRRWLIECGIEPPQSDEPALLTSVLRGVLAQQRALLILDDVWETSVVAAKTLRDCGGAQCGVLASSRSAEIASEVARHAAPLTLDVLAAADALELLRAIAPQAVRADAAGAALLADALGRLPLALKLAGRQLANDRRNPAPCATLLVTWRARLDELRGYETRVGIEPRTQNQESVQANTVVRPQEPSTATPTRRGTVAAPSGALSLDAIIGMSYAALPNDATRTAAAALAVFGAVPLTWDWDAMAAVWATDEAATMRLEQAVVASGLVEFNDETRRYSLHQTVEAFFARRAEPAAYERHATYFAALLKRCNKEIDHESTIDTALATLDRQIAQIEQAQACAARAPQSDFWDVRLINFAFDSGIFFNLRGRYEQRLEWSEIGRQVAQRQGRERHVAGLLGNLGNVYVSQGRYDEAIANYQQSLDIKRRIGNTAGTARTLNNLGIVYERQGRYDDAIDHYQQSLEIKRRIGDTVTIASTLNNLGIVYEAQGRYDKAIDHYQQSLEINHRIGNTTGTASTLGNLGTVYGRQKRYDEAIDHYQHKFGDRAPHRRHRGNRSHTRQPRHCLRETRTL